MSFRLGTIWANAARPFKRGTNKGNDMDKCCGYLCAVHLDSCTHASGHADNCVCRKGLVCHVSRQLELWRWKILTALGF